MSITPDSYKDYQRHMRKLAHLGGTISLLNWDQEVHLPKKAAAGRGEQISMMHGIYHEMFTDDKLGDLLRELKETEGLTTDERKNVMLSLKDYEKSQKFSTEFVEKMSAAVSATFHSWLKAREANDFKAFVPELSELVILKREAAEILGYKEHPYDALMDDYEPEMTTSRVAEVFDSFKPGLKELLDKIAAAPQVNTDFLAQKFDKDKQWEMGLEVLGLMGYDFDAGRQDISTHPFTTTLGADDVRVTTRVDENFFNTMLWSCIHEGGHALYEQGLPADSYGLPAGSATSLSIHESQSRLWENNVGRGKAFWNFYYPKLQKWFPKQLKQVALNDFYKGMNKVEPSLIRVEADELSYHFHIIIRFEIEQALIKGDIEVPDLEEAWNAKYKEYLGLDVPSAAKGVLQDIHWSHGSFGYFPTYSLGSLYAAQFFAQAKKDMPNLETEIAEGNMQSLLSWLREKIHKHGKLLNSEATCEHVCAKGLDPQYFLDYANVKFGEIYGV